MRNSNALVFILGLAFFLATPASAVEKEAFGQKYLTMYMGIQHQEVLSHLPPEAEFLGDFRNLVEADVDRERKILRFTPKTPGLSTMTIHDRKGEKLFEYRIEVRKSELTKVVRELRGLLSDIEGITIKIANDKVLIDGLVLLPQDLNRISGVKRQYGPLVDSLVEINAQAQKSIAAIIEREINNPDIEVRAVNGKFIIKGIANDENEMKRAEIIALTYVPAPVISAAESEGVIKKRKEDAVINLLSIRVPPPRSPDPIVQMVVHYVELSKKYLRSNSFRWSPALQDNTEVKFTKDTRQNSDGIVAEISGIVTNLLPKLNQAKQHGSARILESSSVTTKVGETGVVSSTTQVPYLVRQPDSVGSNTTQFANIGLTSELTPTIVNPRSDIIELKMKFNVSSLIGNTDQGPQTATNAIQTVVHVRSGQSAAVGGLIKNTSGTEYNPDSNPNAIFNLYASKDFRRNKSQFVVFVTPIIKSSASAGSEKIKRKFRLRE